MGYTFILTGNRSGTGGANYIRWGRTTCPDTKGTELLYRGVAAGGMLALYPGPRLVECITHREEDPTIHVFPMNPNSSASQRAITMHAVEFMELNIK